MMLRKRGKGAFTLMELMIVIAIIGILATLAVPSFKKVRLSAKWRACQTNMSTLATAIDSCVSEADDVSGQCGDSYDTPSDSAMKLKKAVFDALVKGGYLKKALYCPYAPKKDDNYAYCNSDKGSCSETCNSGDNLPSGECKCTAHDACQSDKTPKNHWIRRS